MTGLDAYVSRAQFLTHNVNPESIDTREGS
jgi:hypothetical protein